MKTILITGGVGSGKSYVCNVFNMLYNIPVFFTDSVASYVLKNCISKKTINETLGENVFHENGEINRKLVGDIIFNNTDIRKALEKIVHPYVYKLYEQFLLENHEHDYILFECANFIELQESLQTQFRYDEAIVVTANKEIRIGRVLGRSNWDLQKIETVMKIQNGYEKISETSFIIENDINSDVVKQVRELHEILKA